jgi:hypothetical protein
MITMTVEEKETAAPGRELRTRCGSFKSCIGCSRRAACGWCATGFKGGKCLNLANQSTCTSAFAVFPSECPAVKSWCVLLPVVVPAAEVLCQSHRLMA